MLRMLREIRTGAGFRRSGRAMKEEQGFTLVELAVVLAIIGILVAAALPTYMRVRDRAYFAEAKQMLGDLRTQCWTYRLENGDTWPVDLTDLDYDNATEKRGLWEYSVVEDTTTGYLDIVADGLTDEATNGFQCILTLKTDGEVDGTVECTTP